MPTDLSTLREYFGTTKTEILERYFHFLRFESISTDPKYQAKTRECSLWLKHAFEEIGFQTELWETSGHPTVFAENHHHPSSPTVLVYGHYDVQPVEPLEDWHSPPFEPTVRDGHVYARGAQDNKGQLWYFVEAVRYLKQQNVSLPINMKFVVEGEEEIGSPGLQTLLEQKAEKLRAESVLIVDCGIPSLERPAVTVGLRGGCLLTVTIRGPKFDLHAGQHGNLARNPNQVLIQLLAKLHDSDGSVLVPGFYDHIEELSEAERSCIDFSFDEKEYQETFGITAAGGESKFGPNERRWLRPSIEINGIGGGYVGQGTKGIIPASAVAKLSCRLVPGQDPQRIQSLLLEFFQKQVPPGVRLEVELQPGGSRAVRTSPKSFLTQVCSETLSEVFGRPASFVLEGWTVPITRGLTEVSGGQTALIGLALPDDQIHAPNERFSLDRLSMGFAWAVRILEELALSNGKR